MARRRLTLVTVPAPVVSALVLAALLLSGCGSPTAPPATSGAAGEATSAGPPAGGTQSGNTQPGDPSQGTQGTTPSRSATDTASGTASGSTAAATPTTTAAPPSSSGWKTFTTSDGTLSFDYPATWAIRDPAGEAPLGGEFVDVVNAAGKQMAALRTNIVTGAECGDQQPYLLIDSQPLQALAEPGAADQGPPRYVFEARGDFSAKEASPPTYASYGITMMPEVTGPTSCPMFQLFLWPPSGALFGQAYDPAKNTTPGDPGLPYLEKAKLYASTAEYQEVRKMITSLRPAGNGAATGTGTGTGPGTGAVTEPAK